MFTEFLFKKLSHLQQFYGSEKEFADHLLSGEVTVPIPDLIKYVEEYNETTIPSKYKHGDKAKFFCMPDDPDYTHFPGIPCEILAVHFYAGKVKYDLDLLFVDNQRSRIYNVDGVLVGDWEESKAERLAYKK